MEDVAAASGITKLIVYRHFESKEELYRAVLTRVSDRLAEEFAGALESERPGGVGARALLTVAREDPDGFVLLWRHAAREPQFADYAAAQRAQAVAVARSLRRRRRRRGARAVGGRGHRRRGSSSRCSPGSRSATRPATRSSSPAWPTASGPCAAVWVH